MKLQKVTKSRYIVVRVTPKQHQQFQNAIGESETPSEVLRNLINAFIEKRVVVTSNPTS